MKVDEKTAELLRNVAANWDPSCAVTDIEPITPDASLRRYYRLCLKAAPNSLVAMVFDSVDCPEAGGKGERVSSDEAYVVLTEFLSKAGVSVPKLYLDARQQSVLLIEDLGDTALIEVLNDLTRTEEAKQLYLEALKQIQCLQKVSLKSDLFACRRSFTEQTYVSEMREFLDYLLLKRGLSARGTATVERFFEYLAKALVADPQVLCHRDFHSWNLMVDAAGKLRVIDFQDALVGPRCYDIVGLLNDRDTDSLLGDELYEELLQAFLELMEIPAPAFFSEYYRALLQRDLKVAGRFSKLADERGLSRYRQWIPGTLRRIERTFASMLLEKDDPVLSSFVEVVVPLIEEFDEGMK